MKKIFALVACLSLVASLAVGGSIAYLQSTDSAVNVMTLGKVEIEQIEEQRVDPSKNVNLTEADIETFKQGKPLLPYVDVNLNGAMRDDYEEIDFPDGNTYRLFIGDNAIDKFISVKNTGKSEAYVRTIIALERPTDKIDLAFNAKSNWKMDGEASSHSIEVDGVGYDLFVCYYDSILKPDETTPVSLFQIILDGTATNEDAAAYGDTYDVLALSQAVQAAGFEDIGAAAALDTAFGVVNAENAAEWFKGVLAENPSDDPDTTYVSTPAELIAALNAGENVKFANDISLADTTVVTKSANIDLNNHTLSVKALDLSKGGKIANGTVVSLENNNMNPHLKVSGGKLEMEDVNIKIDKYVNYVASGNRDYAEFTGIEAANAELVLNGCDINVENPQYTTWSYVYGVTLNTATLTMNGGSITAKSADAADTDLKTAVCAMGTSSTATLNNVKVDAETLGTTMGRLVLNTTDRTVTDADFVSYGDGTYEFTFID